MNAHPTTISAPDVSVVVPVWNRQDTVSRAVSSLLNQVTALRLEIIVVDDGSTDASVELVQAFQDPRIVVIEQQNQGAAAARARGIRESRADLVAFLDSDDFALPKYIDTLWNALQHDTDACLAYANVASIEQARPTERRVDTDVSTTSIEDPFKKLLTDGCFTASMNLMVRRDVAIQASHKRAHMLASNDYDFCLRVAQHGKFVFCDTVTIIIERLEDGISNANGHRQVAFAVIAISNAIRQAKPCPQETIDAAKERVGNLWPSALVLTLKKGDYRLMLKMLVSCIGLMRLKDLRKILWAANYHRS